MKQMNPTFSALLIVLIPMVVLASEVREIQAAPNDAGIEFDVEAAGVVLFQMAVPDALQLGGQVDTFGITETLSGTIRRDLGIAGVFNLISPDAYLTDPKGEGMDPNFKDWFNAGTQGLVKSGYRIEGQKVIVDLRLYSVDSSNRVTLPAPYDGPVELPLEPNAIRRHTHGFVNEIIRFFTKSDGFFGSRMVVVKRQGKAKELFMVSPDGLEETKLTSTGGINMLPSLGSGRIFFTSFRNGGAHLFSLSKGKAKPFSSFKGLNTGAVLSPDGKTIAATLSKDGNPDIYLLDAETGKVKRQLTRSWGIDTSPSWSPDGKQIAFVSDRHGSPQIWIMKVDGDGSAQRMTFQGDYNQTPDWSPKGDKIAFTARDERQVFDIFVIDLTTGQIQRLTQNQGNNEEPSWSPDGGYVAFTSTRSGQSKLYIMTADGRSQTQVSTKKGSYFTPSWGR